MRVEDSLATVHTFLIGECGGDMYCARRRFAAD